MRLKVIFLLLLPLFAAQEPAHKPSDKIDKDELSAYLAKQAGCEGEEVEPVYFWSVEQFDFLGRGYDQAVVVASTCMTGTAGPDVHSVFTRDEKGELKELKIQEVNLEHRVLFGNANSTFRIEDGLLVDVYHDTSDRDEPLVIKYKWDPAKEQFTAISVIAAKPYKTSYDCDKAEKAQDETAQAICYVETLADLDVELAETYKAYLQGLAADSRKAAIEEQRNWIAQRNKDCVIYKWWVGCLEEKYKARIAELKKRIDERKGSASPQPAT
ncbi:MAG TPA: lysozyme inhibitor LprI family protein [Methylomirabilota bacterium]|nr:lysozyme inhibitor LprI family protein [Methylomirabilota bacterium]